MRGTEIHGFGDALFFSTVQILTISSQLKNPLTTAGRLVDVALEIWGDRRGRLDRGVVRLVLRQRY